MSNPPMRSHRRYWFLAGLSLLGLIISGLLSQHFYELRSGAGSLKSFCNLGQAMNCDAVGASRYAELLWGLPLSSFAAGWYLAFVILSFMALLDEWRAETTRALLAMSGFGLAMSLVYFGIMMTVLHTYCLNCLIVDAVNFVLFVILWTLRPELPPKTQATDFSKWKTYAGIVLGSLFVAVVLLKQVEGEVPTAQQVADEVRAIVESPVLAVKSGPEFPSIGPKDAPITVVEFSDFQCPFCKLGAVSLHSAQSRYPGQVRIVYRHFPLDPKCNRKVEHSMHPFACEAAKVAACAEEQGKFEAVYNTLFDQQATFKVGVPAELAISAGADSARLASCTASKEVDLKIAQDIEEAIQLNVESTPTFFVNGRRVSGIRPAPLWGEVFEKLLAK